MFKKKNSPTGRGGALSPQFIKTALTGPLVFPRGREPQARRAEAVNKEGSKFRVLQSKKFKDFCD
jgi:hypothetical protein